MTEMRDQSSALKATQSFFEIETFVRNLFVSGALLDRNGLILEVSEGWRQFARDGNLALSNYGVGQDYLRHTVHPDENSAATLRGLKSLLQKEIDVFSTLYPCDTPAERKWFLLAAFAVENDSPAAAAVLHIDVSLLLRNRSDVSAAMLGVGPRALDPGLARIIEVVRRTIATSIEKNAAKPIDTGNIAEKRQISALTPRQLRLLNEVARGATNAEIARSHNLTLNSVKSQTTALFRKLGVANRTQAALLAARNGLRGD